MDGALRTALLGRHPARTRSTVGAVATLTLATYVVGRVGGPGLVDASLEHLPLLVGAVVLGLGSVAAVVGYWNEGFAISLAAVFGPTLAWLWLFFTSGTGIVLAGTVAQVVGFATVATAVVGPSAYVAGRFAGARTDGDVAVDGDGTVLAALLGSDLAHGKRTAVLAVALVPAGAGTLWVADLLPGTAARAAGFVFFVLGAVSRGPLVGAAVVALWLAVAGVVAYRGRGLLGAVALVGGPLLGGNGYLFVSTGLSGGGAAVDAMLALVAAAIFAVALGVPGFAVGVGMRRLADSDVLER